MPQVGFSTLLFKTIYYFSNKTVAQFFNDASFYTTYGTLVGACILLVCQIQIGNMFMKSTERFVCIEGCHCCQDRKRMVDGRLNLIALFSFINELPNCSFSLCQATAALGGFLLIQGRLLPLRI
jgi:hypothetical protein